MRRFIFGIFILLFFCQPTYAFLKPLFYNSQQQIMRAKYLLSRAERLSTKNHSNILLQEILNALPKSEQINEKNCHEVIETVQPLLFVGNTFFVERLVCASRQNMRNVSPAWGYNPVQWIGRATQLTANVCSMPLNMYKEGKLAASDTFHSLYWSDYLWAGAGYFCAEGLRGHVKNNMLNTALMPLYLGLPLLGLWLKKKYDLSFVSQKAFTHIRQNSMHIRNINNAQFQELLIKEIKKRQTRRENQIRNNTQFQELLIKEIEKRQTRRENQLRIEQIEQEKAEQVKALSDVNDRMSNENRMLSTQLDEANKKNDDFASRVLSLEKNIDDIRIARDQVKNDASALRAENRMLSDELDEARQKNYGFASRVLSLEKSSEDIIARDQKEKDKEDGSLSSGLSQESWRYNLKKLKGSTAVVASLFCSGNVNQSPEVMTSLPLQLNANQSIEFTKAPLNQQMNANQSKVFMPSGNNPAITQFPCTAPRLIIQSEASSSSVGDSLNVCVTSSIAVSAIQGLLKKIPK